MIPKNPHPKTLARRSALRFLVAAEAGQIQSFSLEDAPDATRGFAREIAAGSLRRQAQIDWTLAPLLKKPLEKLDAPVRAALRLAGYEKWFLQTPGAVLGQEYAGLMRGEKLSSATGFINAILRRLPENLRVSPAREKDEIAHLAVEFSHPKWIVERYLKRFGFEETAALLEANNQIAPLCLRANTLRVSREELAKNLGARIGKWAPEAIYLENGGDPSSHDFWRDGLALAQDEAAQLVSHWARPNAGDFAIDLAAAPGGKATHLAQLMGNRGRILACDLAPGRLKLIQQNAARLGISIIETRAIDARKLADLRADLVLLDAPCSGTGTFRRRPDARWNKTPEQLAQLVVLQRELLDCAANLVKSGGVLVYSTCSLEREENEEQVAAFLERQSGWRVETSPARLAPEICNGPFLQTFPHRHVCDGAFAARLVRELI